MDRLVVAGALLWTAGCFSDPTNPEPPDAVTVAPDEWAAFTDNGWYQIGSESEARSGSQAVFIRTLYRLTPGGYGSITQSIRADDYRGKRVRWSGWVRSEALDSAGLWMRVDGYTQALAFDNMFTRVITGTSDWHQVSVVLDVDSSAAGIAFGVVSKGKGKLVVDDLALDIVGTEVASTDQGPRSDAPTDSAQMAVLYSRKRSSPLNLDFEGVGASESATVEWLKSHSSPLTTTDPTASLDDLASLGSMIGDARIVGLGEGTHGTREFFRLKHRIVRYLVEQKGFTHFAIEASWPEAERLNRYVLTGDGDPAAFLKTLYFWTWSTTEVLEMVNWMRQWNATAPAEKRVRFQGFDMQYPGLALDTLNAFVARASQPHAAVVAQHVDCIARYRNVGGFFPISGLGGSFPVKPALYTAQSATVKQACRDSLGVVHSLFTDQASAWAQGTSEEEYARALQSLRLVQQFEEMVAQPTLYQGPVRDKAMAENTNWLLSRAGPNARMVLWGHNYHVGRTPTAMGRVLHDAHGDDYVNLGFLFGTGSFTAFNLMGSRVEPVATAYYPRLSMEAFFVGTERSLALFDARTLLESDAPPLLREAPMRLVGASYTSAAQSAYFTTQLFPKDFDLLIHVWRTEATKLLP